jgi:hypothetical protein
MPIRDDLKETVKLWRDRLREVAAEYDDRLMENILKMLIPSKLKKYKPHSGKQ